ncbi:MAG: hypothetical protein AAF611_12295 [Bacteroidota bacterium]
MYAQKGYYDLTPITDEINTKNRYIVTSKTLKVRATGQYHKDKAGTPFYTLKRGDIVEVDTARKGVFAGKNSTWFEIGFYKQNGQVVYVSDKELWHPSTVWGIVDSSKLKELTKDFFTVNKSCSIPLAGRAPYRLREGDTVIAEKTNFKQIVTVTPIKKGYLVKNLNGIRKGGGSLPEGRIDNSFLTPLATDIVYDPSHYKTIRYLGYNELKKFTKDHNTTLVTYCWIFLGIVLVLLTIIFIKSPQKKTRYHFNKEIISVNNKEFFLAAVADHIQQWTGSYEYDTLVSERIEKFGDTETHHKHYEKRTGYVTHTHFQGKELPSDYQIATIQNGTKAIQIKLNTRAIAFYYPEFEKLASSSSNFNSTIRKAVGLKFSLRFVFFAVVLGMVAFVIFLYVLNQNDTYPSLFQNVQEVFGYTPLDPTIRWQLPSTYMFHGAIFIAIALGIYLIVLYAKLLGIMSKIYVEAQPHLIQFAENYGRNNKI